MPVSVPHAPIAVAALLLAGCQEPVVEVIEGVSSQLSVELINPTDCDTCDPFTGIDTLRLEVQMDDEVVASDSFAWPGEEVVLPDLTDFGVVRIALVGLAGGEVRSAGRTAEVVLFPDAAPSIPLAFLPVNRALPLAAPMVSARYRPGVLPRRDGSVLLLGGLDAAQARVLPDAERYDPATASFVEAVAPATPAAAATVTSLGRGEWLVSGGLTAVGGRLASVAASAVYADTGEGSFATAGSFATPRAGHCVGLFNANQGLVLGGADAEGEYMGPDGAGDWAFEEMHIDGLDAAGVTGCVVNGEERLFIQGRDADATGVWQRPGSGELTRGFDPVVPASAGDLRYAVGATLLPTAEGDVYVLGGADPETGALHDDGRVWRDARAQFATVPGFLVPRVDAQLVPWISEGWYVAGCGWSDAERTADEPTVELLVPEGDTVAAPMPLDVSRPGCALGVLRDGAVLIAGGGDADETARTASILVPWVEDGAR